jgi:ABC-type transport system involved in multi-copper enzyme maturation permease subunit
MLGRVATIALNTYREAVRARVLHGLFGLALATGAYSLVVGAFALRANLRVVSDLGAASISLYGVIVAIVLGATSLYRELELKTIFPILARPIRRAEYLVGKFLGTCLTLAVFVAANSGALLLALAYLSGRKLGVVLLTGLGSMLLALLVAWRVPRTRTWAPIPWAACVLLAGFWLAADAPDDRRVLVGSALLTLCEVGIVTALATVFASFSSPFLTAVFTLGLFVVGRSADTLANLPQRVFGSAIHVMGEVLSKIVPNLMLYVPPRPLLTGEAGGTPLGVYTLHAALHAAAWSAGLLALASLIFRRRDFL